MIIRTSFAAVAVLAALAVAPASAQPDYYQGKQARIFTMGSPGGGYDTYTRTVSAFLEKRTGARVVVNNEVAAGGMIAMNRMSNAAPDGLTLLLTGGEGLVTAQLYGLAGVHYDIRKQIFLARVAGEDKVAVVGPKSPYKSVADMQQMADRPAIWAGSGKADNNSDFSAIMCYALGVRCKIIVGYKGTGDMNMAITRAEVDGRVISDEAAALDGESSGMRVVTVLARQRSEKFPNVPTIFESKLSPTAERLLDWRAGIASLGRVILVTPGTPRERVDYLRAQLAEILQDPAFVAEVKKVNLAAGYLSAKDVEAAVERALTTLDAKGLAEIKDIALNRYYN